MPAGDCNPECPPITFNDGTSSTPQDQVDSSLTQNYNGTTLGQFSLLNPRFYLEGLITKPLAWLAIRGLNLLGLSPAAVNGILGIAGVAAIPLYEVGTAVGAMNDFFYGGFGVPGAVDNLPVNLPGPYGSGVPMGGGVYWQEEYPY